MAHIIPDNLKSRADVPPAIRRVANAFLVGLDENVICWYEAQFNSSGNRPDFVVLLPDRGICVLEVLDIVSDDNVLGVLRGNLRYVSDGRECEVANPLRRAEQLAQTLRQRFEDNASLKESSLKIVAGAIFTGLTRSDAQKKGLEKICSPENSIFKDEIDAGASGNETVLMRAFTRLAGAPELDHEELSAETLKIIRGIIQPDIVIGSLGERVKQEKADTGRTTAERGANNESNQLCLFSNSATNETEADIVRVMDVQQETLAKSLGDGHRVVRGVAGSGKTLVLVYRAKLLAKCWPRRKYLLTCYTKALAGELRKLLRDFSNVDVVTLDRLMFDALTVAGMEHPGYEDGGDLAAEMALKALQVCEESGHSMRRYHGVFLDEAQDFGTLQLQFATRLLREDSDDLIVVADAAQNIYKRKFSWKQAGIQARGRTRILRINYRNTREILEFAYFFLLNNSQLRQDELPDQDDENTVIPPEAAKRSGAAPQLHLVGSLQEEVGKCIEILQSWYQPGQRPRSIAILYPAARERNFFRAEAIMEALRTRNLPVFWLGDSKDKTAKSRFAHAVEPIVLSPIHSSKGLEFDDVILCGVYRENDPADVNRKLAYVGMTRATSRLAVVSRRGNSLEEDLVAAAARLGE